MGVTGQHAESQVQGVNELQGPGRASILFRWVAIACGAFTALWGGLSLVGWALQNSLLLSLSETPGLKTVAISAGVAWVLLGTILAVQSYRPLEGGKKVIAAVILGFILLYGLIEFTLNLMGSHFVLESALVRESIAIFLPSTPISPVAVVLIIPSALALLLLLFPHGDEQHRKKVRDLIGILGIIIMVVSFTFLISYLYGAPFFYATYVIPIAAPSALAALILGLGLMTSPGPKTVPLTYVVGDSTRARLLRTFIPLVTAIIFVESLLYTEAIPMIALQGALTLALTLLAFLLVTAFVVSIAASRIGQDLERAERKRMEAEEELRESEDKFRSLFTSMTELAVIHEIVYDAGGKAVDYRILDCNPAFTAATGIPRERAVGELASKVYGTREPPYLERYARVAETGNPELFETYFPEMNIFFSISVFSPVKGRFATVATNITDRVEAERRLKESERKLKILADFSYDWEYWIGEDKRLLFISPSCERITGYSPAEFYASPELLETIVYPGDRDLFTAHIDQYPGNQQPDGLEFRIITRDGETRWIAHRCQPVFDEEKIWLGRRGSNRDITDRKIIEQERRALLKDLESKNAELERFTYTVSHDLKSPLITIQGFLGYLKEDAMSGNQEALEDDIRRINNAAVKMQNLLAELLELSRIGRIMNPPEEVPFSEIAKEALDMVERKIQERNILIQIHEPLPVVWADRIRLVEVMVNLLENAVKFMGDQADPRIEIGNLEREGVQVLYVRDNGIGIEPQYKEKIFDLFEKIDPKSEGTGVGLALVKRIIEVHGGKIWIESEGPGKGSCFMFTLGKRGEE
jgi:PAS domain S-box-containing protein